MRSFSPSFGGEPFVIKMGDAGYQPSQADSAAWDGGYQQVQAITTTSFVVIGAVALLGIAATAGLIYFFIKKA